MEASEIKKRFDALESQRKTLDDTLQVIERYVVPHRGEFFRPLENEQEVEWRRRDIYDSTAVDACETLAASMQGNLTSATTMWFGMTFRNNLLSEDQAAQEWLEECGKRIYQSLSDSNFNLESSEFYLDLTSFGTAVIFEEAETEDKNNWKGLDFQAAPLRDCYFEMTHKNQVKRFYRRYQWTPLQIVDKFGIDTPTKIQEEVKRQDSNNRKYNIVFCVYEREDKKQNIDSTKTLSALERPFGWKWVMHETGEQIGKEGGYYEQPAFVARWRKTSGSQWGYSPAHIVLSDILTLQELTEETLESLGKAIDPSTLTTERNLMSDLDIGRGGLTVVKDIDGIKVHESRARFDVGELRIDRLQESIRRAFRVDQLELKNSPAMTATEVQVRYELMQRLLGPTLGRLQADFLDPLINRTFKILYRAGLLPETPESVVKANAELDIEYIGPLPRAQRQEVVLATNQWLANNIGLVDVKPEVLDNIDFDAITRDTAALAGLPAKYLVPTDKVTQVREERAAEERELKQNAMAQQEGEAMKAQGEGQEAMNNNVAPIGGNA